MLFSSNPLYPVYAFVLVQWLTTRNVSVSMIHIIWFTKLALGVVLEICTDYEYGVGQSGAGRRRDRLCVVVCAVFYW